jgi:hypothetical protein
MMRHRFAVVVDRPPDPEQVDSLEAMTCLVVDPGPRPGLVQITVDRAAPNVFDAVLSAVRDVESVGLRPMRVVDRDCVTLADVAGRVGRSREAVRLWSTGRFRPGGFPPPLNPGRDTAYFSWAEIVPWLREHVGIDSLVAEPALRAANLAVQLRALAATDTSLPSSVDVLSSIVASPPPG